MTARGTLVTLAALAVLGALAGVVLEGEAPPGPGGLSAVHAREAGLSGSRCDTCHTASGTAALDAGCTSCHLQVARDLDTGAGLHGRLAPGVTSCSRCHVEHRGADASLTDAVAFRLAGVEDPVRFDHHGLQIDFGAAHAALACDHCHDAARARVLPRGGRRFGGLSGDCASCHDAPHDPAFLERVAGPLGVNSGADTCGSCHAADHGSFLGLDHAPAGDWHEAGAMPLAGPHAELACAACHGRHGEQGTVFSGRSATSCGACHGDPHGGQFREVAQAGCSACHGAHGFLPAAFDVDRHGATAFPLEGAHRAVACGACHDGARPLEARRYAGTPTACGACHSDPHGAQFARGGVTDCRRCHDASRAFRESTFDHDRQTRFALEGPHEGLACGSCHTLRRSPPASGASGPLLRYTGLGRECVDCHDPRTGGPERGR